MLRRLTDAARKNDDRPDPRPYRPGAGEGVRLGDIVLRNRVVTSSSLLGYGGPRAAGALRAQPVRPVGAASRFGAVTTRTLTVEPREGHFTLREDWRLRELPGLMRALRHGRCAASTPAG